MTKYGIILHTYIHTYIHTYGVIMPFVGAACCCLCGKNICSAEFAGTKRLYFAEKKGERI